ncbi:MAG: VOC family protein [Anaerolineae bacterium]|nr:VOC family protein [Anaerolineae bacterium]
MDHVELFVPDQYEAARWYQAVFGMEVLKPFESWAQAGPLMISSDGGSTKLALFKGQPLGDRAAVGFRRVAFRVDGAGFLTFLSRLEQHPLMNGGQPVTPADVVDHDLSFSIYFVDPWGNPYEVTTYDMDSIRSQLRLMR